MSFFQIRSPSILNGLAPAPAPALFSAAVTATVTPSAGLTTSIPLNSAITATVVVSADLNVLSTASGALTATAALTGALTTAITAAAAVSASVTSSGSLTTSITPAAAVTATVTPSGSLTTSILLSAAPSASVTPSAALTTQTRLAAALSTSVTVSGTLSGGAILFASSLLARVTVTALLDGTEVINREGYGDPLPAVTNADKTQPFSQWTFVDVIFPETSNTDMVVPHTLTPLSPEQVGYMVVRSAQAGSIYHDTSGTRKAWQNGYIVLRSSVANARVRLLLFVEHGQPTLRV